MPILETLIAAEDPARAAEMAAYHKAPRRYLGLGVPQIDAAVRDWRAGQPEEAWVAEAASLWDSDIHEARIAAAKLLTKARLKTAEAACWDEICRWVPTFDAWAVADHACKAGERRLVADPSRLDAVEGWTRDENVWVRRAALVMTLPWARLRNPKPDQLAQRERVLGWAAGYVSDREWFIQKAVAWWLRTLATQDADRVWAFMDAHGVQMKAFARKDAVRKMTARGR